MSLQGKVFGNNSIQGHAPGIISLKGKVPGNISIRESFLELYYKGAGLMGLLKSVNKGAGFSKYPK